MPGITIVGNIDLFLDIYNFADKPSENPVGGDVYYDKESGQLKVYDENTNSWVTFDTSTSEISSSMILVSKDDDKYNNPRKGYVYIDNINKMYIYDGHNWIKIGNSDLSNVKLININNSYVYENDLVHQIIDVSNTYVYEFMIPINADIIPYFYVEETDDDGNTYITNVEIEHKFTEINGQKFLHLIFEDYNLPNKLQIRFVKSNRIVNKYILINDLTTINENTKVDVSFNIEEMKIEIQNNNDFELQNVIFEIPLTQLEYDAIFQETFAIYDENGIRVPYIYDADKNVIKIKIQSVLHANSKVVLTRVVEDYTQEVDIFYKYASSDLYTGSSKIVFSPLQYSKCVIDVSWIPRGEVSTINIQINGYSVYHRNSYSNWNRLQKATYSVTIDENGDVWYGSTKIDSNVDTITIIVSGWRTDKSVKGYLYEIDNSNVHKEIFTTNKTDDITFDGSYMIKSYGGTYLQIYDKDDNIIKNLNVNKINIINLTGNYYMKRDSLDKFSLWKISNDLYIDFS